MRTSEEEDTGSRDAVDKSGTLRLTAWEISAVQRLDATTATEIIEAWGSKHTVGWRGNINTVPGIGHNEGRCQRWRQERGREEATHHRQAATITPRGWGDKGIEVTIRGTTR